MHTILGHFDFDIDFLPHFLGFSCLEHISCFTANFPKMCLMLNQFLWGHSSRYCDFSCSLKNFIYAIKIHNFSSFSLIIEISYYVFFQGADS